MPIRRSVIRMCGIIGVFRREGNVAAELYEGLLMLQHRGQDSAGMVTTDWFKFREHKDNGLVKDVFDGEVMATLEVGAWGRWMGRAVCVIAQVPGVAVSSVRCHRSVY